ncbi:MAG: flagellar assembly peptidoglycan hydrolase FlgJ [Serpentinimonas sp.]|nr:flagellar assembly peptidoglycan hydrolase FlgJ [Serpentinimonas sp.]
MTPSASPSSLSTAATMSLAQQRGLALDSTALDSLKHLAGRDSHAAIRETARQFEALFMRELLKSMREASTSSGLMGDESAGLGSQMLDEQWALKMTGLPRGLGEMIERQLLLQTQPGAAAAAPAAALALPPATAAVRGPVAQPSAAQAAFVGQHRQVAQQVERESGIPASFMIGKAAHETGWGRSPIRNADGSDSFNLFGIKATPGWRGRVAEITTTEYINGAPQRMVQRFRAYDTPLEAFRDYARLIGRSPRYAEVMQNLHSPRAFAQEVQQAGFATDPRYAQKLERMINATINVKRALG